MDPGAYLSVPGGVARSTPGSVPGSVPGSIPGSPRIPPEQRDPWFRAESELAARPTARLRTKLFPARSLPFKT